MIIVLQTFIAPLGGGLGRFLPMFLGVVYGESIAWAGVLTGIMQGVGCISLILGGVVADRYDKVWIISGFTFLTGLSTIILTQGHFTSTVLLLILVFRGFVQYFAGPARHSLVSVLTKSSPKGFGLEFAGSALGGSLSRALRKRELVSPNGQARKRVFSTRRRGVDGSSIGSNRRRGQRG